jgi:hypothetical protein
MGFIWLTDVKSGWELKRKEYQIALDVLAS